MNTISNYAGSLAIPPDSGVRQNVNLLPNLIRRDSTTTIVISTGAQRSGEIYGGAVNHWKEMSRFHSSPGSSLHST